MRLLLALALCATMLAGCSSSDPGDDAVPSTTPPATPTGTPTATPTTTPTGGGSAHTISIQGSAFHPATLDARPGDTVTFRNDDGFAHTATADNGAWDTGRIEAGASKTITVGASDTPFHCAIHPSMKGTIRVV